MEIKEIKLGEQNISYNLKTSYKARALRLEVGASGLIVIKPFFISFSFVDKFIRRQSSWILKNLVKHQGAATFPKIKKEELAILKKKAAKIIIARLEFFNQHYNLKYKRICIRDQKTRWGSCSKAGTLNFNYRLVLLREELLDYVVVHELCHLKEMNHSLRFWNLVAETLPDFKSRREALENFRLS